MSLPLKEIIHTRNISILNSSITNDQWWKISHLPYTEQILYKFLPYFYFMPRPLLLLHISEANIVLFTTEHFVHSFGYW